MERIASLVDAVQPYGFAPARRGTFRTFERPMTVDRGSGVAMIKVYTSSDNPHGEPISAAVQAGERSREVFENPLWSRDVELPGRRELLKRHLDTVSPGGLYFDRKSMKRSGYAEFSALLAAGLAQGVFEHALEEILAERAATNAAVERIFVAADRHLTPLGAVAVPDTKGKDDEAVRMRRWKLPNRSGPRPVVRIETRGNAEFNVDVEARTPSQRPSYGEFVQLFGFDGSSDDDLDATMRTVVAYVTAFLRQPARRRLDWRTVDRGLLLGMRVDNARDEAPRALRLRMEAVEAVADGRNDDAIIAAYQSERTAADTIDVPLIGLLAHADALVIGGRFAQAEDAIRIAHDRATATVPDALATIVRSLALVRVLGKPADG